MPAQTHNHPCILCNSDNWKLLFSQQPFSVISCTNCGYGYLANAPSQEELFAIYQEDYHEYLPDEDFWADAKKKFQTLNPWLKPNSKIMDFGTGRAHFLHEAKRAGHQVFGYDISAQAVKEAKQRFDIEVTSKDQTRNAFKKNSFDMITLFDVIEHIPDFLNTLEYFHYWLKPDGFLCFTTPDMDSWDAKLMGKKWYGYTRIPQHVNYFSRNSIHRSLAKTGFVVTKLRTWGFVRSLDYLLSQYPKLDPLRQALKPLNLSKTQIYLPMMDMLVIAQPVRIHA